jgi:hypothetical protein
MAKNFKSLRLTDPIVDHVSRRFHEIVDSTARRAADMVMVFGNDIEPGLVLACVELLDDPGPSQKVQVPVHCAKTDVGQTFAHDFVQGCSRRM